MFQVHTRNVPMAEGVDLEKMARATVGFTGADIQNLINEAALWATRHNKENVEQADFEYAQVKVVMGLKREETLNEDEKKKTAWHEAGHTVVGWFEPVNSRVHKVSIIPRGRALGATMVMPEEDQLSIAEKQLRAEIAFLMGGRVAERMFPDNDFFRSAFRPRGSQIISPENLQHTGPRLPYTGRQQGHRAAYGRQDQTFYPVYVASCREPVELVCK
jgi:ATP-dependent Zn protease